MLRCVGHSNENTMTSIQFIYNKMAHLYQTEQVQAIIGTAQLILGSISAYKLCQFYLKNKSFKDLSKEPVTQRNWKQIFTSYVPVLGHLSYVGTALTSPPMVSAWNKSVAYLFSKTQIECFFGINALIPGHYIYYLLRIGSFLIGIPSMAQYTYVTGKWLLNGFKEPLRINDLWHSIQKVSDLNTAHTPPTHIGKRS